MPIYEYECTSCHHQFDLIQKINDAPETLCPQCSEHKLVKLISAAGFQLKGTGWYETDFKNKGQQPKSSASQKDATSTKTENTVKDSTPVTKNTSGSE